MEMYAGRTHCRRVYGFEPSMVDQERGELLNEKVIIDTPALTDRFEYGIVSGRLRGELDVALEMTGLASVVPACATMTADDGLHKPDPNGLIALADRMAFSHAAFVGDTLDDMRTVQNYNAVRLEPDYLACQVLTGPAGEGNRAFFAENGADVIAPNVNALLRWFESFPN
jgi:phosphoglycolate phosphatase-like HAD superfamily hydrolase